nr:probable protein phosphatase 2C 27 isoform X2 [Ipomoea batatas]
MAEDYIVPRNISTFRGWTTKLLRAREFREIRARGFGAEGEHCLRIGASSSTVPVMENTLKVFDGHGGTDAESFVRNNILKFITEDSYCPICLEKAMKNAFLNADYAFVDDSSVDTSSGTTALTALLCERKLVIANAGDCRAVLGKRGRAIELSKDHKPDSKSERHRIEKLGGVIYNGYLNGQLSVARALGDWHMKAPKGSA